ncbi:3-phosphoshikimate 1-carboxyvinyltransferase [Propionicicella superfundia]|uniref:3-phosphoshikimate 1-carboxyvinyltransferase n=1 Tax=Propionicicella superfundia TaxID=348582 RepID=UPI000423A020|nr:3-phosphoshikimate 1-carboxyvinyltransferase [Propionicicella superfundia]
MSPGLLDWLSRRTGPVGAVPWTAPTASAPITRAVRTPGSKSATNRALVLAALADGPSLIGGALDSRDTSLMLDGLRTLGVETDVERHPRYDTLDRLRITPPPAFTGGGDVDCGLAGTVMRFVPPVAGLAAGTTRFHGDRAAESRPLEPLLRALGSLGVRIDPTLGLPFSLTSDGTLHGGQVEIDSSASSQFVSGLLMIGARCESGLTIRHVGAPVPSRPHLSMTLTMLQDRGVDAAETQPDVWRVEPGAVGAMDEWIEPDLTNLATFMAAVGITGGHAVFAWPDASTQPGEQILAALQAFGITAAYRHGASGAESTVAVSADRIVGADIDLHDVSELTCTAAALAAVATGPSRIRGVAHIRGHETDRLAALEEGLSGLGCAVAQTDDGLTIEPRRLRGGLFRTHADHRLAHAAALVGLVTHGVVLDDVACTSKTMPDFVALWEGMLS